MVVPDRVQYVTLEFINIIVMYMCDGSMEFFDKIYKFVEFVFHFDDIKSKFSRILRIKRIKSYFQEMHKNRTIKSENNKEYDPRIYVKSKFKQNISI